MIDHVQENFYHVLECNTLPRDNEVILPDPDAPELPPPFKADTPPPPIYHDINDLPVKKEKVRKNDYTNCSIPSERTNIST